MRGCLITLFPLSFDHTRGAKLETWILCSTVLGLLVPEFSGRDRAVTNASRAGTPCRPRPVWFYRRTGVAHSQRILIAFVCGENEKDGSSAFALSEAFEAARESRASICFLLPGTAY